MHVHIHICPSALEAVHYLRAADPPTSCLALCNMLVVCQLCTSSLSTFADSMTRLLRPEHVVNNPVKYLGVLRDFIFFMTVWVAGKQSCMFHVTRGLMYICKAASLANIHKHGTEFCNARLRLPLPQYHHASNMLENTLHPCSMHRCHIIIT